MAEEATVPPKLPRLTQASFWGKTLDEKKEIFNGVHPTLHSKFFKNLKTQAGQQKDPDKQAAMQADLSALKQHQQETQGAASLALLIGRSNQEDERPRHGLAGAVASGQPVALHYRDENENYTFRAVTPSNLTNYLHNLPKNIELVHVTHRRAGFSEPAHSTQVRRSRTGTWEEIEGSHEVHGPEGLLPDAPYLPYNPYEKRKREKAESETTGRLREAVEAMPAPELPSTATAQSPRGGPVHSVSVDWTALTGNVGRRGAEHLHNVLMARDPEYAANFHAKAEKFGAAEEAVEKAAAGHAESIRGTEEILGGRRLRYSQGAGNVDLPAYEEGLTAQGGGGAAAGGPSADTAMAAQGTVYARPMDHTDAMIHDVVHLTRAVMHNSSNHLLNASPDIPEFTPTEIPEIGSPGVSNADERNIAARNLGVRDAKASEHIQGMLGDINGTTVHPSYINNFPVHHYISKVAADAGVDTDDGRLQDILDNAQALQQQRHREWKEGPAIGVSAVEHITKGTGGTPIVRSHAARRVEPGSQSERFYREGLTRTSEAALAEYGKHLATSDFSVMPSSGELAYQRARQAAAGRNGVAVMPDAPNEDETLSAPPPDLVAEKKQERQARKGAAPTGRIPEVEELDESRRVEASESAKVQLQGTHLPSASHIKDLEDWASNFLAGTPSDPDANAKAYLAARMAHPSRGLLAAQFAASQQKKEEK
jgi:hypothetical protein